MVDPVVVFLAGVFSACMSFLIGFVVASVEKKNWLWASLAAVVCLGVVLILDAFVIPPRSKEFLLLCLGAFLTVVFFVIYSMRTDRFNFGVDRRR